MSDLSVFEFQSHAVRTLIDERGEPWFVGKDVCDVLGYADSRQAIQKNCKEAGVSIRDIRSGGQMREVLGYANATDAMKRHCKGVAKRYPLQTLGGTQEVRVLAEPDVMRLIVVGWRNASPSSIALVALKKSAFLASPMSCVSLMMMKRVLRL
jgi:prophage antirepressor-like protein